METLDPEVLNKLVEALARERGYASFFQWPDRQTMECGLVRELLQALPDHFPPQPVCVQSCDQDPPDCVLDRGDAKLAVEVTELVDRAYLEAVVRARGAGTQLCDWASWDSTKFLACLNARVKAKANPAMVEGGPYDEYVLLVHTAEPGLDSASAATWMSTAPVSETGIITRGYLLFDYRPPEGNSCLPIPFANPPGSGA